MRSCHTCVCQRKSDFWRRMHVLSYVHIWFKSTLSLVKHTKTFAYMRRHQYHILVYVVMLYAYSFFQRTRQLQYTETYVFLPYSCEYHTHTLVYFTLTCHTCVERCTPKSFLTVLALFLTHMSNFPMFLGCPKVTFSYAFMYLTHWPSHTLSPCVKRA
jgi:hypothetical protein